MLYVVSSDGFNFVEVLDRQGIIYTSDVHEAICFDSYAIAYMFCSCLEEIYEGDFRVFPVE